MVAPKTVFLVLIISTVIHSIVFFQENFENIVEKEFPDKYGSLVYIFSENERRLVFQSNKEVNADFPVDFGKIDLLQFNIEIKDSLTGALAFCSIKDRNNRIVAKMFIRQLDSGGHALEIHSSGSTKPHRKTISFPSFMQFKFSTKENGVLFIDSTSLAVNEEVVLSGFQDPEFMTTGAIRLGTIYGSEFSSENGVSFSFGNLVGTRGEQQLNFRSPEFVITDIDNGIVSGIVSFADDDSIAVLMISESLDTDFTPLLSHRISKQDFTLPFPLGSGSYILRCRTIKKNGLYSYLSLPVIVDVPSWDPVAGLKGLTKAFIVDPATGKEERLLERDKLYELHIKLNEIKEVFALLWLHHTEYSGGNYENRGGLFNRKFNYVFNFSLGVEPIFYAGTEEIGRRSIRVDGSEYLYIEDSDNFFRVDSTDKTARIRFRLLPEAYPGEWILSGYLEHSREKRSPMFVAKYKVLNAAEASILEKQRDKERKVNIALYAILSAAVTTAIVFGSATYIRRKRDKNRTAQESVKARLIDSSYNVKDENHPQKHLVMRAQKFIHENYQNSISLSDVAQELKCSEVWAAKIFRQAVGMTVVQYITKIRIEKACELLSGTSLRITDIALKIGYSNMVHFGRVFKAEIGVTPKDYRKSRLPIKI